MADSVIREICNLLLISRARENWCLDSSKLCGTRYDIGVYSVYLRSREKGVSKLRSKSLVVTT